MEAIKKSVITQLTKPEEIFVDIREEVLSFKDKYKNKIITIPESQVIYSSTGGFKGDKEDTKYLCINPTFKIKNEEPPPLIRKSFWLRNSELFAGLCNVLSQLANADFLKTIGLDTSKTFIINDWIHYLNAEIYTIDPKRNWYGFTVNLSGKKEIFQGSEISEYIDFLKNEGYYLIISAENGFGEEATANIFLQIGSETSNVRNLLSRNFDLNTETLTLERTNLISTVQTHPDNFFKYFNGNYSINSLNRLFDSSSKNFKTSLNNFVTLYHIMKGIPLDSISYKAIVLDLYDRNRNEWSVDLDERLQNLIKKTLKEGELGIKNNEYNWASLIRSVVLKSSFDLTTKMLNNPYNISHLFSKKMVIQKMERIYSEIFKSHKKRGDPEEVMRKYIEDQIKSISMIGRFIQW